jgi:hypothetical protein
MDSNLQKLVFPFRNSTYLLLALNMKVEKKFLSVLFAVKVQVEMMTRKMGMILILSLLSLASHCPASEAAPSAYEHPQGLQTLGKF